MQAAIELLCPETLAAVTTDLALPWAIYGTDSALIEDATGRVVFRAHPPQGLSVEGFAAWVRQAARQTAHLVAAANAHGELLLALAGLLAAVDRGEATPTALAVVRARQALAAAREARS